MWQHSQRKLFPKGVPLTEKMAFRSKIKREFMSGERMQFRAYDTVSNDSCKSFRPLSAPTAH